MPFKFKDFVSILRNLAAKCCENALKNQPKSPFFTYFWAFFKISQISIKKSYYLWAI